MHAGGRPNASSLVYYNRLARNVSELAYPSNPTAREFTPSTKPLTSDNKKRPLSIPHLGLDIQTQHFSSQNYQTSQYVPHQKPPF